MNAVLAQVIEAQVDRPDCEERVQAAVSRVLTEYPGAIPAIERLADGAPPPRAQDLNWLALVVDESAQVAHTPSFPRPSEAPLPVLYIAARQALEACVRLDEAATLQNRFAALATAARVARDETLVDLAMRIQAHAVRRCGQLLLAIAGAPGARTDIEPSRGALTRLQSAKQAGLSKHQLVQAIRVANVPPEEFERQVESGKPATVTELAALSRQRPPAAATPATSAKIDASVAVILRQLAIDIDTDDAVRAAWVARGVTAATVRWLAEAVRGFPARGVQP